jgi:hypothetical protein
MKRRPKLPLSEEKPSAAEGSDAILQVKFWLTGISPMVWRRVLVPATFTLRELHGVIQVATGREGIHRYDFHLRGARYGSWGVSASSPDITLTALRFRKGAVSGLSVICMQKVPLRKVREINALYQKTRDWLKIGGIGARRVFLAPVV